MVTSQDLRSFMSNNWLSVLPATPPTIIMGMHRSGTSILTKILSECGLYIGSDLDRNYESRTFKRLNEFLINTTGGNWDYPAPVEVLDKDHKLRNLYLRYLRGQINSLRCIGYRGWNGMLKSQPNHWGWKDPRNSFTLGIWNELYPDCRALVIERHGVDVALSLIKRREKYLLENSRKLNHRGWLYCMCGKRGTFVDSARCFSLVEAVQLWSEYAIKARFESRKLKGRNLSLRYEEFLFAPERFIKKIISFIGIEAEEHVVKDICSKVNPQRAFAYRTDCTIKRLSVVDYEKITEMLTPFGYSID